MYSRTISPLPSGYTTQSCPYSTPPLPVPSLLTERSGTQPCCFLFLYVLPCLISFAKLHIFITYSPVLTTHLHHGISDIFLCLISYSFLLFLLQLSSYQLYLTQTHRSSVWFIAYQYYLLSYNQPHYQQ